jgi:MFS family permease
MPFLRFLRENAPFLLAGVLLSFLSSFGQTFFISIFGGEIRAAFGLSNGEWGGIYTLGTGASAVLMLLAGGLTDKFRVRFLGTLVVGLLGLACFAMALNPWAAGLPFVILALRFFGQGMTSTVSVVAMARWFVATRGRALAIAALGFSLGEATLPLTFVWLKRHVDWHLLWLGAGVFCLLMLPVLLGLLRLERTPLAMTEDHTSAGMDGRHWTRIDALRSPLFWSLSLAMMLMPAFSTAFWFHQVHFAEVKGWDHLTLVAVFPLGTLALVISTQVFGWAIDRWGVIRLLPVYLLPFAVGFLAHAQADHVWWSAVGIILMGVSGGGQSTIPAACWAQFFGTRHIGAIKSTVVSMMVLGSAIGPGLTGWLIDLGYSFQSQLWAYAAIFLLASGAMVLPLRGAAVRLSPAS